MMTKLELINLIVTAGKGWWKFTDIDSEPDAVRITEYGCKLTDKLVFRVDTTLFVERVDGCLLVSDNLAETMRDSLKQFMGPPEGPATASAIGGD